MIMTLIILVICLAGSMLGRALADWQERRQRRLEAEAKRAWRLNQQGEKHARRPD